MTPEERDEKRDTGADKIEKYQEEWLKHIKTDTGRNNAREEQHLNHSRHLL